LSAKVYLTKQFEVESQMQKKKLCQYKQKPKRPHKVELQK